MQKYGGTLVHSVRDEHGLVEVVEHGEVTSLYFETPIQQSSIVLHEPQRLVFDYYRAMCTALLFKPEPKSVLVLGLGGGILARFLLDAISRAEITAVEFREAVVDVAYSHFGLPDTERLQIWITEAAWFLTQTEDVYDIIMVDVYDALGLSDSAAHLRFFDDAMVRLEPGGILVMNLWRSDKDEFSRVSDMLEEVFSQRVLFVEVDDANSVALAFPQAWPNVSMKALKRQAAKWEDVAQIDLARDLKKLRRRDGAGFGSVGKASK